MPSALWEQTSIAVTSLGFMALRIHYAPFLSALLPNDAAHDAQSFIIKELAREERTLPAIADHSEHADRFLFLSTSAIGKALLVRTHRADADQAHIYRYTCSLSVSYWHQLV